MQKKKHNFWTNNFFSTIFSFLNWKEKNFSETLLASCESSPFCIFKIFFYYFLYDGFISFFVLIKKLFIFSSHFQRFEIQMKVLMLTNCMQWCLFSCRKLNKSCRNVSFKSTRKPFFTFQGFYEYQLWHIINIQGTCGKRISVSSQTSPIQREKS